MSITYDKATDTLYIVLNPHTGETTECIEGDFSVLIDDDGAIADIEISHASRWITLALQAGVKAEMLPDGFVAPPEPVWEDVESSMIAAFKYHPLTCDLEVMFHNSGLYRYTNVPDHIVRGLREADSKGRYMRDYIIHWYD